MRLRAAHKYAQYARCSPPPPPPTHRASLPPRHAFARRQRGTGAPPAGSCAAHPRQSSTGNPAGRQPRCCSASRRRPSSGARRGAWSRTRRWSRRACRAPPPRLPLVVHVAEVQRRLVVPLLRRRLEPRPGLRVILAKALEPLVVKGPQLELHVGITGRVGQHLNEVRTRAHGLELRVD
eukprot:COSAG01_NODE_11423_length_1938_cov_2.246873_3_plen_179_part_00